MPLNTFDQAPLKNALDPSSLAIFLQQSIVPLYIISAVKTKIKVRSLNLYSKYISTVVSVKQQGIAKYSWGFKI